MSTIFTDDRGFLFLEKGLDGEREKSVCRQKNNWGEAASKNYCAVPLSSQKKRQKMAEKKETIGRHLQLIKIKDKIQARKRHKWATPPAAQNY